MPLCQPSEVEEMGALFPALFNLPDQPSLDALVQRCINRADAWMQGHMGANYNLILFPWQIIAQNEGQIYLTLVRLAGLLKAEKTYGTHQDFISEDASSYERLISTDWDQMATDALDLWVTVERDTPVGFAMPTFGYSQPVPLVPYDDSGPTGLDPREIQYEEALSEARGKVVPFPGGSIGR
jgi:hypothetical protein